MKQILIVVAASVCLLAGRVYGSDVPTPCRTCPSALRDWSAITVTQAVVTLEGCVFTAFIKQRTCPANGCREVKVEKIVSNPNPCPTVHYDDMMTAVLGHMIVKNSFDLDSGANGASACIVIIRPACWRIKTAAPSPCGDDAPGAEELIDAYRVRYKIGQLMPCDTAECCTNTNFVTVSDCNDPVHVGSPTGGEYKRMYRLQGRTSEDPAKQAEIDSAEAEFDRQFLTDDCRECGDSVEPPPAAFPDPTVPPPPALLPCKRSCQEDLVLEYYKLVRGGLLRKYGGQN